MIDLPAGSTWILLGSVWLGIGLCALGWGGLAPSADGEGLDRAVALAGDGIWLPALGVLIVSLRCVVRPARSAAALALVGVFLGLCCAKSAARPLVVHGAGRGLEPSLVQLDVRGAPRPGGTCARWLDAGTQWSRRWPTPCEGSEGDRFVVRRDALERTPPPPPGGLPAHLALHTNDDWSMRRASRGGGDPVAATRRRYWAFVARIRQRAWRWSRGDDARGMVVASTLGLPGALSPSGRQTLRIAGLGHLIAVSGLHVGLLAVFVMRLALRLCGGRPLGVWLASMLGAAVVLAFVGITGGAAPAVRAAAMYLTATLAALLGRPAHHRLMPAAVLTAMVVVRPAWIVDPGFQLSAAATWAIVSADPPSSGSDADVIAVERSLGEGWRAVGDVIWLSWRIAWATAAVSAFWFGRIAWTSILVNVAAVPIFAWIVLPSAGLGWVAAALGYPPDPLAGLATAGANTILDLARVVTAFGDGLDPRGALVSGIVVWCALTWMGRERPGVARWRPPGWAVFGLLVGEALANPFASPPSAEDGERIVAAGRARSEAHYVGSTGGQPAPCLDVSQGTVIDWPRWLRALELAPPAIVLGDGPEADALRRRFSASADGGDDACAALSGPRRRRAIDDCLRRQGQRRAVVEIPTRGSVRCRVHGGWRRL